MSGKRIRGIFNESSRTTQRWALSSIRYFSSNCFSYWTFSYIAVYLPNELFSKVDLYP